MRCMKCERATIIDDVARCCCACHEITSDETERIRCFRKFEIESGSASVDENKTWTTDQVRDEFNVIGFLAPFVVVIRKRDGAKGSLEFTHNPRVYFNWRAD